MLFAADADAYVVVAVFDPITGASVHPPGAGPAKKAAANNSKEATAAVSGPDAAEPLLPPTWDPPSIAGGVSHDRAGVCSERVRRWFNTFLRGPEPVLGLVPPRCSPAAYRL